MLIGDEYKDDIRRVITEQAKEKNVSDLKFVDISEEQNNTEFTEDGRMLFEVFGEDKIKQFDLKEQARVKVGFDPRADQKDGHWYGNNRAWSVEHIDAPIPAATT